MQVNSMHTICGCDLRDHGGAVVTHSPPTSDVGGANPGPHVGKLIVAYRWSAVNSTEP